MEERIVFESKKVEEREMCEVTIEEYKKEARELRKKVMDRGYM